MISGVTRNISHTIIRRMAQLLKAGNKQYVDLTVSFTNDKDEDVPGPPIRYFLS